MEGMDLARERDTRAAEVKTLLLLLCFVFMNLLYDEQFFIFFLFKQAWVGHPYIDVIDNSTDFDTKLRRLIAVCTILKC